MMATAHGYKLDPVTFEVIKNSLITTVDEMAEQILRTCHSFVIYCRDFSNAICDRNGNTIAQGRQDIAVHVGTLHFTAQAVLNQFAGDIYEGDVFAVNDPYRGGTHFNDVRIVRPIFVNGEMIAMAQSNGHWADVGGTVPGSFDITAKEHFGEGLRIPPVRIVDRGVLRKDLVQLLVSNTRAPAACEGDLHAQVEATAVGMRGVQRLVSRYGLSAVLAAFDDVQDYVEQVARNRIAQLPDGSWETTDYLDSDPDLGEGLIPIRVKLTVSGDQLHYDLSGSHPCVGTFLNSSAGSSFSAVIAGTKTFFPDVPLNSGFYRAVTVDLGPEGTVVNAPWPIAVTGFCSGPFEKIMNAIFEIWSGLMPERALACSFNLEYLLVGGWDVRAKEREYFMWYDWMAGGWGGRNGRDGINCTAPVFGAGLAVQPLEGQERLSPVLTTGHQIRTDSGGPGAHRGGCGVEKGAVLTDAERTVISYSCDRARSLTWGLSGGLPSIPHGTWLKRAGSESATYLGASFSGVPLHPGDMFTRPSAGGGGFGDPLDRPREQVLEDVIDGYVSIERAALDYGVVVMAVDAEVCEYEIDVASTAELRADIRASRHGWLEADAETVAAQYRNGEISMLDVIRRFGVILHWETGELFRKSTKTFREQMKKRSASHWDPAPV